MNKNTLKFIVFSALVIFGWFFLFPQEKPQAPTTAPVSQSDQQAQSSQNLPASQTAAAPAQTTGFAQSAQKTDQPQQTVLIENENYKVELTNIGAGVLSWQTKEQNGQWVELILDKNMPAMINGNEAYTLVSSDNQKAVFEYVSPNGWKITKTFSFSQDSLMHNLNIKLESIARGAFLPPLDLGWGPGLGTDERNLKDNLAETRITAYPAQKPFKLEKFKNTMSENASQFAWATLDNRYFLIAFIPKNRDDFAQISSDREDKKHPYSLTLKTKTPSNNVSQAEYSIDFYVGPKGYSYLKTYNLGLEETVDFGFFGFLGRLAFSVLTFLYGITGNFGWAIIILTIIIQILISPLTFKSFRSMAAMKKVQPLIKEIQDKYKNDKQRLQAEMMNLYKVHKVNPLGGCLPMLCQLPIFWAFFTMLRNAYELRGAGWILWVNDLSAADSIFQISGFSIHLLPLIMGAGMFFQQKMTTATSDPTQKKMMYILPIVFTFMFWSFPAGLVLYWLTNSVCSMAGQFAITKRDAAKVKKA